MEPNPPFPPNVVRRTSRDKKSVGDFEVVERWRRSSSGERRCPLVVYSRRRDVERGDSRSIEDKSERMSEHVVSRGRYRERVRGSGCKVRRSTGMLDRGGSDAEGTDGSSREHGKIVATAAMV